MEELTPKMVQEAWCMAAHEFEHECFEDGTRYYPYPYELIYGFDLETLLKTGKKVCVEDLIIYILGWDVKALTKMFMKAHRGGHRNYVFIPHMGHVHYSQLPELHRTAKSYFETL